MNGRTMSGKGPTPALVTTSLIGSGSLMIASGPPLIVSGGIVGTLGAIAGALGSAAAALGGTAVAGVGAASVPLATLASPFFTMFLDLFSGLSRGFWDASLGNDLFSEVLGTIACHSGACGGTAAAATAVTAAPCPFC